MAWSIRSYNAFVRDAREEFGINYEDAVDLYRTMKEELGRSVYAVDLEREYDTASGIVEEWLYDEVLDTPVQDLDSDWLDYAEIDLDELEILAEGTELEITADLEYAESA